MENCNAFHFQNISSILCYLADNVNLLWNSCVELLKKLVFFCDSESLRWKGSDSHSEVWIQEFFLFTDMAMDLKELSASDRSAPRSEESNEITDGPTPRLLDMDYVKSTVFKSLKRTYEIFQNEHFQPPGSVATW